MTMRRIIIVEENKEVLLLLQAMADRAREFDNEVQRLTTYTPPDPHKPAYGPPRKRGKGKIKRY